MENCLVTKLKGSVSVELPTLEDYNNSVNLGLPSGTRWRKSNVGAANPLDTGYFFSWGNVEYHYDNYNFGSNADEVYAATPGAALTGNIPSNNTYDAARAILGSIWRMPTEEDFTELFSNCSKELVSEGDFPGMKLTSLINGNSISIPFVGVKTSVRIDYREAFSLWTSDYNNNELALWGWGRNDLAVNTFTGNRFYGAQVRGVAVF